MAATTKPLIPVDYHNTGEIDVAPSASDAPRGPASDRDALLAAADPATTRGDLAVPGATGRGSAPVHRHQPVGTQGTCATGSELLVIRRCCGCSRSGTATHGDFSKRGSQ